MSKAQIIDELPKLSPDERREILHRIHEIDHNDWLAENLSPEEIALIEERLAAHQKNPAAAIPWNEAEARLVKRFGE
jgi:putative addiction module component (TIGR02574 family)